VLSLYDLCMDQSTFFLLLLIPLPDLPLTIIQQEEKENQSCE
jgi:hypothetical protein